MPRQRHSPKPTINITILDPAKRQLGVFVNGANAGRVTIREDGKVILAGIKSTRTMMVVAQFLARKRIAYSVSP